MEVQRPTIFGRYANTQAAHLADIIRPRVSTDLDFEGELAIIIGKAGRYIARERAFEHIAGYSCYNDASLRDCSITRISSPQARTFRAPVPSVRGW